jgi:hypothetical protein
MNVVAVERVIAVVRRRITAIPTEPFGEESSVDWNSVTSESSRSEQDMTIAVGQNRSRPVRTGGEVKSGRWEVR